MPEKLPNGKSKYSNVKILYYFEFGELGSYPRDSVAFNADVTYPPKLAYIIGKIINNDSSGINEFLNYQKSEEFIPIDQRIEAAVNAVDKISTLDIEKKERVLVNLKYLIGLKGHHNYFDYDILREYYDRATKLLGIQLVKEIRQIDSNKVLLKQFAETHQSFKNQR